MGRSKVVAWQSQQRVFGYLYRPCSALGGNERNSHRLVESGHQLFLGAPVSRAWRHSCINDRRMSLDSGDVVPLWLIRRWLYLAPVLCCFVVSLPRRFLFPTSFFFYNFMDVADFTFFVLFVNSYLRHFIFGFLGKLLFSNFRRLQTILSKIGCLWTLSSQLTLITLSETTLPLPLQLRMLAIMALYVR